MLPVTLRNLEPQVRGRMVKVDKEEGGLGRVVGKILNLTPERVDDVQAWLRRVASASRERSILSQDKEANSFNVPKPMGARAFEVVGIPLKKTGQFNQRIIYPPTGAVIALDPDIPQELQKVFFISQTIEERLRWKLNGRTMDRVGKAIAWTPIPGEYRLAIADGEEKIVDSVYFEVRGGSPN